MPAGIRAGEIGGGMHPAVEHEEVDMLSLDFELGWGQPKGLSRRAIIVDSGRYPEAVTSIRRAPRGASA